MAACKPVLALLLAVLVLVVACSEPTPTPTATPEPTPTLRPTSTPRPLHVNYVDAAGRAESLRARAEQECVETPERPSRPYFCAALLSTAAHYQGYANQRRAGSKLYGFKISLERHWVTFEEVEAKVAKLRKNVLKWKDPEEARELNAWERVLQIIEREKVRGNL